LDVGYILFYIVMAIDNDSYLVRR